MFKKLFSKSKPKKEDPGGVIAKIMEDDKPVILAITKGNYTNENKNKFPQLIIIAWKYDGSENNGMPSEEDKEKMNLFQDVLEHEVISKGLGIHAVSRTGNNLKEFEYYFADQEAFMQEFNNAFSKYDRFPIDIKFYKDPEWKELKHFMDML